MHQNNDWEERVRDWVPLLVAVVVGILALILKVDPRAAVVALVIVFIAAIAWWYNVIRKIPKSSVYITIRLLRKRIPKERSTLLYIVLLRKCVRLFVKWAVLLIIIAGTLTWAWFLRQALQPYLEPQFEITALNTLTADKNAYEVTDLLLGAQNVLNDEGVGITFTLQIRPEYSGEKTFGQVVVIVSDSAGRGSLERVLWTDLGKESRTQLVHLTLSEVNRLSGIESNFDPPHNILAAADRPFQQAKLIVQVAPKSDPEHPWASQEILIRNAPWSQRSELIWRTDHHEVDLYVKNLGGTGDFTFYGTLVHLDREVDTSSHPMWSGTTQVGDWRTPEKMKTLKPGEFFTDTLVLHEQLSPGRYLVEVYAIKKQEYVRFLESGINWDNLAVPWWFSRDGNRHFFVIPASEIEVDATIQAERDRLRDEQGIDLGSPIEPAKEVVSVVGTIGLHQTFEDGEIYAHNGQAYALYGSILDHYNKLEGSQNEFLGFPISLIQPITSSLGVDGLMMEFEGPPPEWPSVMYSYEKVVAATWGWIGQSYLDNGGHSSWLGFPLEDARVYSDSIIQMFEMGYVAWYTPYIHYPYEEGDRDYTRPPVAYSYITSRGKLDTNRKLLDVHAELPWQDTGISVQSGDRVTIVQVDGMWTYWGPDTVFDANGDTIWGLQDGTVLSTTVIGALIGKIGEDDSHVFPVGRWSTHTAQTDGPLYLAMNDGTYEDNAGLVTVQIMVERTD